MHISVFGCTLRENARFICLMWFEGKTRFQLTFSVFESFGLNRDANREVAMADISFGAKVVFFSFFLCGVLVGSVLTLVCCCRRSKPQWAFGARGQRRVVP